MINKMTAQETAKRLGISISSLYVALRAGKGPAHYRLGNKYLFDAKDVDDYLQAHRVPAGQSSKRSRPEWPKERAAM